MYSTSVVYLLHLPSGLKVRLSLSLRACPEVPVLLPLQQRPLNQCYPEMWHLLKTPFTNTEHIDVEFQSVVFTFGPSDPGPPGPPLGPFSPLGPTSPLSPGEPLSPCMRKQGITVCNTCLTQPVISGSRSGLTLAPVGPLAPTSPAIPWNKHQMFRVIRKGELHICLQRTHQCWSDHFRGQWTCFEKLAVKSSLVLSHLSAWLPRLSRWSWPSRQTLKNTQSNHYVMRHKKLLQTQKYMYLLGMQCTWKPCSPCEPCSPLVPVTPWRKASMMSNKSNLMLSNHWWWVVRRLQQGQLDQQRLPLRLSHSPPGRKMIVSIFVLI